MNRVEAKRLAETVTNEQLKQMILNAQEGIKDWTKVATVNKGLTKGAAFNIFSKFDFDGPPIMHSLAKINALREFGEFLPGYEKPAKKAKREQREPFHQEPNKLIESPICDGCGEYKTHC